MPNKSDKNKKPKGKSRIKLTPQFLGGGLARDAADKLRARDRRIRNL